jgi:hypothetical protein
MAFVTMSAFKTPYFIHGFRDHVGVDALILFMALMPHFIHGVDAPFYSWRLCLILSMAFVTMLMKVTILFMALIPSLTQA